MSSSPSGASVPRACASDQLMVLASSTQGAAGTGFVTIDIANRGATCRIGGRPHVSFYNSNGVAIDRRDLYVSSMLFAEPRSVTVTLVHDGSASLGVSWSDNTVNNQPYNTTCPRTTSIYITLRGGDGGLAGLLPLVARPCGGSLEVTPIESGAVPRPNG
jgi:hypothetical protein